MMNQQADVPQSQTKQANPQPSTSSRKVSDHLANERTFFAWIRTGLATITFGFVVEQFGLVVHELNPMAQSLFVLSFHASSLIGVMLTAFDVIIFVVALISFLRNQKAIIRSSFIVRPVLRLW